MDYSGMCRVTGENYGAWDNYCTWRRHHEDNYMDEHIYMWFKTECGRDYYESLVNNGIPEMEDFLCCPWCRGYIDWR